MDCKIKYLVKLELKVAEQDVGHIIPDWRECLADMVHSEMFIEYPDDNTMVIYGNIDDEFTDEKLNEFIDAYKMSKGEIIQVNSDYWGDPISVMATYKDRFNECYGCD